MRSRLKTLTLWILVGGLGALACDLSTLGLVPAGKPKVTIQSPASNTKFREGDQVAVQSTATDPGGIVRVELAVDGATVRTDVPPIPQGQISFTLVQNWAATPGNHTVSVRAFNKSGTASDPAFVPIVVEAATAGPAATTPGTRLPSSLTPTLAPAEATPVATATRRPPTRPPATATPSAPPGVWAASIRVDPTSPKRGQFVTFYVTFLNTTGNSQDYRWRIRIYEPDKRNSLGDTAPVNTTMPVNISELASADNWRITGPGDCLQLLARVFWIDPSTKQETEFLKPDQSGGPAAGFQVCP